MTMRTKIASLRRVFIISSYPTVTFCRLSPRMISTVGAGGMNAGIDVFAGAERPHDWGRLSLLDGPHEDAGLHARGGRGIDIERIAQRQLNLAFGAGERQALGLIRRHDQRDDGD
jgi:hypothetical protein